MTEQLIARAEILLQQRKLDEAGKLLKDVLSKDPSNIRVLAMLAEIKIHQGQHDEAGSLINNAIGLSPDTPWLYYIKARVNTHKEAYDEAESNLQNAITLDPADADFFALWASINLARKKYERALELADEALQRDPENILALNIRSTALLKLDRKEESFRTIEGALAEDPHNAYTHANYGWSLLEKGENKKALEHFREALRINPHFEYARSGMAEALKARYWLYKLFLKYAFWIGNLTAKYQWAVIIGLYIAFRFLNALAENNETLRPYLTPLIIAFAIFAFSTWIITPVSNLFLRLNSFGRYLLDKNEIRSSNLVGISFLVFVMSTVVYLVTNDIRWIPPAFFGFAMMIPLSVLFSFVKNKKIMLAYTAGLALAGTGGIVTTFNTGAVYNLFATIFIIGFIAFQWLANYLRIRESNR
ncbi:MAG: tetratricopeptide repeat protein [Chitinophagaceae bacterium]|nr:tetratricopeptide repeat protein [Chitinophagaceae bacterium]